MINPINEFWCELPKELVRGSSRPLHAQLFDAIKTAVDCGHLMPGEPVISSRQLALVLGISRVTVIQTYKRLISQGYFEAVQSSGTYVRRSLILPDAQAALSFSVEEVKLSRFGSRLAQTPLSKDAESESYCPDMAVTPSELLPMHRWRSALVKSLAETTMTMSRGTAGIMPLRTAIADYVRRNRSIVCSAQQVAIFSNVRAAIHSLSRLLLDEGSVVALENPCSVAHYQTFAAMGAKVVPIPVDGQGFSLTSLTELESVPDLILITPSHQNPTGALLPLERRRDLLKLNEHSKSWIIEDDIDFEFRYGEPNLPALQTFDRTGHTIYMSSFRRVLHPLSSLAYVILPESLVLPFERLQSAVSCGGSTPEQLALAKFLDEGTFEEQVRVVRAVYSRRRQALIAGLTRAFGRHVSIARHSAGLHQLVKFQSDIAEGTWLELAQGAGLSMVSSAPLYLKGNKDKEFLVPFFSMREEQILQGCEMLAHLVAACERPAVYVPISHLNLTQLA